MPYLECQSIRHGSRTTITSHVSGVEVRIQALAAAITRSTYLRRLFRDPTKHSTLKDEIEEQSTALYETARLWDDGIIKPVDTRDTVGLALALSARERVGRGGASRTQTSWDGDAKGYGVLRM